MNGNESLTTTEIKKQNCKKVFDYLYQNQRTSKQTIAQALGLSMPTVSQNLKLLEGAGVVRRDGFYESTGGRKAHVLRFVQDARVAVGVAILEGSVQLCAVDLLGEVLREETHPLPYENSDGYYQQVGRLVRGLMAHLPYGKERVLGVGIAIQGLVSADGERVVYGAILNNNGVTREMFQRYIPYPCRLLHDTEVGAAAEFWHNQEIRDAIYLVLNRNMGGALVVDGKVQQGSGIIEHMTLFPGGEPCYCGKKGCVEAYCSANSLRRATGFPVELFFQRLRAGDGQCRQVWDEYLQNLALAMDNMRMLVDCKFVIGGYLQQFLTGEDMERLTEYIHRQTAFPELPICLTQSRYGPNAAVLEAAIYYIDQLLQNIEPLLE